MAVIETRLCHRYEHPEFRIGYDPALVPIESDLEDFLDWLEGAVAGGERFADGETCQVGWLFLKIRSATDGFLTLWEPDIRQFPIHWVEGVNSTLSHLRLLKDVCESVPIKGEMAFPSLMQPALVCTRLAGESDVVMERENSSSSDSGWFCGCCDEDHDHTSVDELQRVSLYEAVVCYTTQIVPYLALPDGVLVIIESGVPAIYQEREQLEFMPGSYLQRRFNTA